MNSIIMNPIRESIPVILTSIFFCVFVLSLTLTVRSFLYHKSVTPDLVTYLARPMCDDQAAIERVSRIMGGARVHLTGALRGLTILSVGSTSLFAALVYTLRRIRPGAADTSYPTQHINYRIRALHVAELAFCLSMCIVLWQAFAYTICIAPLTSYIEEVRIDQFALVKASIFALWNVAELVILLLVFVSAAGCVLSFICFTICLRGTGGMSSCGTIGCDGSCTSKV